MKNVTKGILFGTLTTGIAAAVCYRMLDPEKKETMKNKALEQKNNIEKLKNDATARFNNSINELRNKQDQNEDQELTGFKKKYSDLSNRAKNQYTHFHQVLIEKTDGRLDIDMNDTRNKIQANYNDIKQQAAKFFEDTKNKLKASHSNSEEIVDEKIDAAQDEFDIVLDAQQDDVKAALGLVEEAEEVKVDKMIEEFEESENVED